jgi:hypothetical protein
MEVLFMTDQPLGDSRAGADRVSVVKLCAAAGIATNFYYREVKAGRAPKPINGVPLLAARAWLKKRVEKAAQKAAKVAAGAASLNPSSVSGSTAEAGE